MNWQVQYHPDALKDLKKLDGSQQVLVKKDRSGGSRVELVL